MPRGTLLTELEKGQILGLHSSCISVRAIAIELNRSRACVSTFLERHGKNLPDKKNKNASKLSPQRKRALLREAKKGESSANELRVALNMPVSTRRIQQIISADPHLRYRKIAKAPYMTPQNRENRYKWARHFVTKGSHFWVGTVFSDEKSLTSTGRTVLRTTGMIYGRISGDSLRVKWVVNL